MVSQWVDMELEHQLGAFKVPFDGATGNGVVFEAANLPL